jgi:predicted enzyme related to lactoylglutathione lyase
MARLNYLELPVADTAVSKAFYAAAFGWGFSDFGPTYAATTTGDTDVGLDASPEKVAKPLPVVEVDDLDAALTAVVAAGGRMTVATFAFPGGRRFHFADPDGHELAVMQTG